MRTRGSGIDMASLIELDMVCYEFNQFEETDKYFNDTYNYGKYHPFRIDLKNILSFICVRRRKSSNLFHSKQTKR